MKRGLLVLLLLANQARATGFTDLGQDIAPRRGTGISLDGSLRTRGEALWNLDLDRGLTPSGQALFPTPLGDPGSQLLTHADMRLRTDLSIYAPGGGVAVKVRLDVLDNVTQGSTAEGICMRNGPAFTAAYVMGNAIGLVIYEILPDGTLDGLWTVAGQRGNGTEGLTPR